MAHFLGFFTVVLATSGVAAGRFGYNRYGCQDVYSNFNDCESFVEGAKYDVPYECCNGLERLNALSKSEYGGAERICRCIENMAAYGSHPPFSESHITDLYYRCNIHLSFPISEHMDCSSIY